MATESLLEVSIPSFSTAGSEAGSILTLSKTPVLMLTLGGPTGLKTLWTGSVNGAFLFNGLGLGETGFCFGETGFCFGETGFCFGDAGLDLFGDNGFAFGANGLALLGFNGL